MSGSAKTKIIVRTIILIVLIFCSLFPYFYFNPNKLLFKYVPVIVCGGLGYFLSKKYAVTIVSGIVAFGGFIIPPYFMSQFYILPQLMSFVEIMALLSSGYFIMRSISWFLSGRRQIGVYSAFSASVIIIAILLFTGFLPNTANRLIADEYMRENYEPGSFKHVLTEFNGMMDNYLTRYENENGEYIAISTNSVIVMYDSRKGNG